MRKEFKEIGRTEIDFYSLSEITEHMDSQYLETGMPYLIRNRSGHKLLPTGKLKNMPPQDALLFNDEGNYIIVDY